MPGLECMPDMDIRRKSVRKLLVLPAEDRSADLSAAVLWSIMSVEGGALTLRG